jgi:hypothetical protein
VSSGYDEPDLRLYSCALLSRMPAIAALLANPDTIEVPLEQIADGLLFVSE